jgi:hypothetical protein
MPHVLNIEQTGGVPEGAVYVGRSKKWGDPFWGNPFLLNKTGSNRNKIIREYERWLCDTPDGRKRLRRIGELTGKDLICHCAPEPCHADVLLRYANPHAIEGE